MWKYLLEKHEYHFPLNLYEKKKCKKIERKQVKIFHIVFEWKNISIFALGTYILFFSEGAKTEIFVRIVCRFFRLKAKLRKIWAEKFSTFSQIPILAAEISEQHC